VTPCVVDASVAVKWYVPEENANRALSLLARQEDGEISLHVPELFFAEVGNIVWKKQRTGRLLRTQADLIVGSLLQVPYHVHSLAGLLPHAVTLACELDQTVYDAIYLSLALSLRSQVITADSRFRNRLEASPYRPYVRWVGDLS
jgi:predicted nucleic acid-binding protein